MGWINIVQVKISSEIVDVESDAKLYLRLSCLLMSSLFTRAISRQLHSQHAEDDPVAIVMT